MSAFLRGLSAEQRFRKLLGDKVRAATGVEDVWDHFDFEIKVDVKKVRAVDSHGESSFHWMEIRNVNGEQGWLYGKSDFIAFEALNFWIVVPTDELREFVKTHAVKKLADKLPYHYYRRQGRKDLLVMMPTMDLFRVEGTFTIQKQ